MLDRNFLHGSVGASRWQVAAPTCRVTSSRKSGPALIKFLLALSLSLAVAGCESIGPTVDLAPAPGQSQQAFAAAQSACMAQTDAQLQPVANQEGTANLGQALTGNTNAGAQQVATNAQLQTSYNTDYANCMSAHGAGDAAASTAPTPPWAVASDDLAPDGGEDWALFYVTPNYPPGEQASQESLLSAIWNRAISASAARGLETPPIHYGAWTEDGGNYELSVADQSALGTCQPIGSYSGVIACPAKLTHLNPGVPEIQPTSEVGTVCIFAGVGGVASYTHGTRFRYDAASNAIVVETVLNGEPIQACARSFPVS